MAFLADLNWDSVCAEAERHLTRLIQFQTINPPGDELPAAEYLAEALRRDKLEPEIITSAPGRGNLICRLKGTGEKPPLLLNGHLDVVPVEESQWKYPPFAAQKAEGYIWGRGAVDMKHMVAMSLTVMLLAKRSGAKLKRDLIFAAVADEEAGGAMGAGYLVQKCPDKLKAEYALGEMGGFSMTMAGKTFYPVQVAEKGICWLRITTTGEPGHGSIPNPESAPIKLARALRKLGHQKLPQHNTPVVELFLQRIALHQPFPKNLALKLLLNPSLSAFILEKLFPDPALATTFWAMLRNTANPTVLRAGEKTNVIPSVATAEVDGRLLPGQTKESFLAEVRSVIGDNLKIEVLKELTPTSADPNDPILDLIAKLIEKRDPGAVVIPNLVPGFTDATHYSKLGIKCFGFSPVKLNPEDNFKALFHGHNERIPVAGFHFGVRLLAELVEAMAY
jgi:acetylornithine deacetylase/succinyl-diaminopimelate desuccinylase-like protein